MNDKLKKIALILGLVTEEQPIVETEVIKVQEEIVVEPTTTETTIETEVELTEEPVEPTTEETEVVETEEVKVELATADDFRNLLNRLDEIEMLMEYAAESIKDLKSRNIELSEQVVKLSKEPAVQSIKQRIPRVEVNALADYARLKNK